MKFILTFILLSLSLHAAEFKDVEQLAKNSKVLSAPYLMCKEFLKAAEFEWTSSYKKSTRTVKPVKVFGEESIESIIHFNKKKRVSKIELLYFSKADSVKFVNVVRGVRRYGTLTKSAFEAKASKIRKALNKSLGLKGVAKVDKLGNTVVQWKRRSVKYALEVVDHNDNGESLEYLRLVIESVRAKRIKFYTHEQLQKKVKKKRNGDTYITALPMVDQGNKGYCVCASLSRVLQHFGREVHQHEIARMANSGKFGTSYEDIKNLLVELSPKVHVANRKLGDFVLGVINGDSQEKYLKEVNKELRRRGYSPPSTRRRTSVRQGKVDDEKRKKALAAARKALKVLKEIEEAQKESRKEALKALAKALEEAREEGRREHTENDFMDDSTDDKKEVPKEKTEREKKADKAKEAAQKRADARRNAYLAAQAKQSEILGESIKAVMKTYSSEFRGIERSLYNAIDLGRPVAWALQVGLFAEKGIKLGETGGHMRLIVGYNRERKEIIYTDSWGKGHEFKRVSVEDAIMSSFAMWELRPKL